jgi:predicted phosphodiesterase
MSRLRVVVLSDIHSNLQALDAVISDLPRAEGFVSLGDIVGYGPQPNEVIHELQLLQPSVVLLGNHDHAVVTGAVSNLRSDAALSIKWTRSHLEQRNLHFLSGLKPLARGAFSGVPTAMFHGSPRNPLEEYVYPNTLKFVADELTSMSKAKILMLGHTHIPTTFYFGEKLILNPGSVGQPRDGDPRASYGVLDISQGKYTFEVRRIEYDVRSTADMITDSGLPKFLADRLYLGL